MAMHGTLSVVMAFVLTGISTSVIGMRFYARHFLAGKLSAEDWIMALALIAVWGSVVVNWYLVQSMDYSGVTDRATLAAAASRTLLMFWIYRINYIFDLCVIKASILLYYIHLVGSHKRFDFVVRALFTIILLGTASMIFAAVFTCYPVSDAWSFDVFELDYFGNNADQCYHPGPFLLFNAGFNLVTDVIIWTLPLLFFLTLSTIPLGRRLELVAIFSVGLLAIVASAVRLRVMVLWLTDVVNSTENTANLLIWSQVEQHTGIIAASIPFILPLFRRAVVLAKGKGRNESGPIVLLPDEESQVGRPGRRCRTPIIPSPCPTFDEGEKEFKRPVVTLAPIEPVHTTATWGTTIWDGTQVRQVLAP